MALLDVGHGAVHDPDLRPRVRHGRRGLLHHPREHRRHLDHEEHGEREPHEQGGELALVVDEELVGDAEDPEHGAAHRCSRRAAASTPYLAFIRGGRAESARARKGGEDRQDAKVMRGWRWIHSSLGVLGVLGDLSRCGSSVAKARPMVLRLRWSLFFLAAALSCAPATQPPPKEAIAESGPAGKKPAMASMTSVPNRENPVGKMARIPEATFRMGSEVGEPDELPVHAVHVAALRHGPHRGHGRASTPSACAPAPAPRRRPSCSDPGVTKRRPGALRQRVQR